MVLYLFSMLTDTSFVPRLQFEARNQKKEAKEMAVIEAMRRKEQEGEPAAQPAH